MQTYESMDTVLRSATQEVMERGAISSPRGLRTRELVEFSFRLDNPRARKIHLRARRWMEGTLSQDIVTVLDRILLILMIVEILYTVQVSFREHTLVAEPFLIVGLIAAIRRILVLTAEFSRLLEMGDVAFRNAIIELGLLTVMVGALVASLFMLRKPHAGTPTIGS